MQAALVAIFNACKQSLGRGNVFISVSQSFYPGGCLPLGLRGVHPLWTHTPWMPPQGDAPLKKRAVRIVLECIFVSRTSFLQEWKKLSGFLVTTNLSSYLQL